MSNFEKEFYVPMRDLIRLYDSSDLGESREITAIVYPHREYQLQSLDCRKFVIVDDVEILQKQIESLKAELAKERGKNLEKANSKLSEENKILRKALEYYEDVSIWDYSSISEKDLRTYVPYGQEDDEVAGGRYAKDTLDLLYGALRNY